MLAEVDGYEFHSAYEAFLRDRRQKDLTLGDRTVLRFAAVDGTERPKEAVDQARAALTAAAVRT